MTNNDQDTFSAIEGFDPECERSIRSWWTWPKSKKAVAKPADKPFEELVALKPVAANASRLA